MHSAASQQSSLTLKQGGDEEALSQFMRIEERPGISARILQVAVVSYKYPQSETPVVDLVGAVHIGEKSYYQELNQRFENYDAVLYELVAPHDEEIPKGGREESAGLIGNMQIGMKNILGLGFQLEEIDYTVENFVHADMSPEEFEASMKDRGESFFSMFLKMWAAGMSQQYSSSALSELALIKALFSSNRQQALKNVMAEHFIESDGVLDVLEGKEGSTLITERNKKALQVLRTELQKPKNKHIAIFYGAGHMKDFNMRLIRDFGFEPFKITWIDAWDLSQ